MKSLLLLPLLFNLYPAILGAAPSVDTYYFAYEASEITQTNIGQEYGITQYLYEVDVKNVGDVYIDISQSGFYYNSGIVMEMQSKDNLNKLIAPNETVTLYSISSENYSYGLDFLFVAYTLETIDSLSCNNIEIKDGTFNTYVTFNMKVEENQIFEPMNFDYYGLSYTYQGKQYYTTCDIYEQTRDNIEFNVDYPKIDIDASKIDNVTIYGHLRYKQPNQFPLIITISAILYIAFGISNLIGVIVGVITLVCLLNKKKS